MLESDWVDSRGGRDLDFSGVGGLDGSVVTEWAGPKKPGTAVNAAASPASMPGEDRSLSVVFGIRSADFRGLLLWKASGRVVSTGGNCGAG